MKRLRFTSILTSGALLAAVSAGWAQEQTHAIVVGAAKRAVAPPLSQVAPIPLGQRAVDDEELVLRRPIVPKTVAIKASDVDVREISPLANLTPISTNSGVNALGIGVGIVPSYKTQASVPDTSLAVGPTQIVEFVNESFAVFDKSGNLVSGPTNGDTLWQTLGAPCYGTTHLDEIAQYDKQANRWVMMMPAGAASPPSLCIAVSQTSDAVNGGWYLYQFPIPTSPSCSNNTCRYGPDYPKLAVWVDAYYLSYNEDNANNGQSLFAGDAVCALDRTDMLAGNAASTMQCFMDVGTNYGNLLPADLDGANLPPTGSPEYFLDFNSNDAELDLWQFHVDWTTPANSTFGNSASSPWTPNNMISVPSFTEPCGEGAVEITYTSGDCIPQIKTTNMLDSYGDRLMYRLAYRNLGSHQSLLANHTIEPGGHGNPTAIQWYELQDNGSGFSLYQQGTYSPDSEYRWMGSIAMDQAGDIALGYNVSGSNMSPSIRYTGREPSDSLGQMESEIDILSAAGISPGSATESFHWADYSTMTIDPADDCTFWFASEYIPTTAGSWATRMASFSFPSCAPGFTVNITPTAQTVSAGASATYGIAIAGTQGFSNPVTVSCSAPTAQGVNCSLASSSVIPGNSVNLTVTTTAPSTALTLPPRSSHRASFATWLLFPALGFVGIIPIGITSKKRKLKALLPCALVAGLTLLQFGCGGGNNGGGQQIGGTPAGTYTVNITATSGNLSTPSSVTITVQ